MGRVLFVIETLAVGGSSTSLAAMLALLREDGRDYEVFVMQHGGHLCESDAVRRGLLPQNRALAASLCPKREVRSRFGFGGVVYRNTLSVLKRIFPKDFVQRAVFKRAAKKLGSFDTVIAYQEGNATEFAKYIAATRRIAWIHTIYDRFAVGRSGEDVRRTYEAFDRTVCVAEAGAKSFSLAQPSLADRVCVLKNPLDEGKIIAGANEACDVRDGDVLVSVGRLSPEKQFSYAVAAAAKLRDSGRAFTWYLIGGGEEEERLRRAVGDAHLSDSFIMTGALDNPYPLMKRATLLVMTSAYEAQPMCAAEALTLGVPIVTTNHATSAEITGDGKYGVICENSADGVFEAVAELLGDRARLAALRESVSHFKYDNSAVLEGAVGLICGDI